MKAAWPAAVNTTERETLAVANFPFIQIATSPLMNWPASIRSCTRSLIQFQLLRKKLTASLAVGKGNLMLDARRLPSLTTSK